MPTGTTVPAVHSPAPEAQELKEQAKEEDEEEDAEDGSEKAKEATAKAASMPAVAARDEIGRHRATINVACEQTHHKALRPARIVDSRADAEQHQCCDADDRPFGQFCL